MTDQPTPARTDAFTHELQRIRELIGTGQLHPAALALNQAQQQAPADPRVLLLGMRLAEAAGNPKAAEQAARRAVQMAPDWHVALIELALLLARQQQGDEALQLARQALALAPYDVNVMVGAINTGFFAGQQQQTLAWAEQGARQFPDDAGIRRFLSRYLLSLGRHQDALGHLEYMHQRDAQNTEVLDSLVDCARQLGDGERMRRYANQLIGLAPADAIARYWHAVAHGQTPATQPPELVARLFDEQAKDFDQRVVGGLQYHLPERVAGILQALHPDRRFNLLDLGCGTGLVGLRLGRLEGHIVGVELSAAMIAQAAAHGVYSRIHQVNVLDALQETPADHYEAITCTDVLIYVGDLAPVLPNACRILKPGGHFIFSCETAGEDEADLVLRSTSNRYAHKASAVERQCRAAGFEAIEIEHLPALRLEAGQPVAGLLVTARKPA
jgi:predicted TPR repeat methyltransferase